MRARVIGTITALGIALSVPAIAAKVGKYEAQDWSFKGIFGSFDRKALRRGYQVYAEVCASCHSLRLVAYRNLRDIGFSRDEVKAIAAAAEVQDGPNDEGEMFERKGRPSDRFVSPFPNANAARAANNGAFPPDLSLVAISRLGGADYLHGVLTGYRDEPPAGVKLAEGMNYNAVFPGNQIAMPPPLSEDGVEYADGTKATVQQMSRDVVTFMAWAAEPEMEERKSMGLMVILFLIVFAALMYAVKKRVWADAH